MSSGLRIDASSGKSGFNRVTVLGWSSRSSSPRDSSASAARIAGPPEFVMTAVWRERGSGLPVNAIAMSNSSSTDSASNTPDWVSSASTATSLAAIAPVCDDAARADARAARLHRNDRFGPRDPRRELAEPARIPEALDVHEDDADGGVVLPVFQQVVAADVRLVAH
jgi:hypothetical protein